MTLFVKLCGIRTPAELEAAVEAGADAVGFVLTPSPRQVPLSHAARLVRMLPARVLAVAVFHDPTPGLLSRTEAEVAPDLFQAELDKLAEVPADHLFPVVVDGPGLAGAVDRSLQATTRGMVLVDSAAKGGTGRHSDLRRIGSLRSIGRVVLAGGLNPRNVGWVVSKLGPLGVDVSSGIEREPGVKDPGLMREFVAAARAAEVTISGARGEE